MNVIIPFLMTTIAGLSTLLGSLIIFIKYKNKDNIIISSLAFAASIMLFISILDLLPESYNLLNKIFYFKPLILLILIGLNIGIILSFYINKKVSNDNKLYRVGLISMIIIIIHNIPEGMATFIASNTNIKLGIKLTIAISLHNIPEGISIAIPIYYATNSKYKAILYTFISGLSELLGAILTYIFLYKYINNIILGFLFSIIAGIMIYISIKELLPESFKYKNYRLSFTSFLIGILIVVISKYI